LKKFAPLLLRSSSQKRKRTGYGSREAGRGFSKNAGSIHRACSLSSPVRAIIGPVIFPHSHPIWQIPIHFSRSRKESTGKTRIRTGPGIGTGENKPVSAPEHISRRTQHLRSPGSDLRRRLPGKHPLLAPDPVPPPSPEERSQARAGSHDKGSTGRFSSIPAPLFPLLLRLVHQAGDNKDQDSTHEHQVPPAIATQGKVVIHDSSDKGDYPEGKYNKHPDRHDIITPKFNSLIPIP